MSFVPLFRFVGGAEYAARVTPIIVLPGANSKVDLAIFSTNAEERKKLSAVKYPDWQSYLAKGLSADALIRDIVSEIVSLAPQGPIHIVGISLGGHFGYAAALRLQATGRHIAGFCAIDTFMIASSALRVGWKKRALELGVKLVYERRVRDIGVFIRSNFWRALLRLAGNQLLSLLRIFGASGRLPFAFAIDPIFQEELSMRLLLREAAPWIGSLDVEPVALMAPALLLRTSESASDDPAWRLRCPGIEIIEIAGTHHTIFDQENIISLRNYFFNRTHHWFSAAEARDQPAEQTGEQQCDQG
jgi:thioesterase domain-containing protein